jgi:hypothetical protein
MTRQPILSRVICKLVFAVLLSSLWCHHAWAVLVYHQTFDNADGVPTVTPGGGVLAVNATASFAATGGISGGVLNANVASPTDATPLASTIVSGGTPLSGLGTVSQFTMTFWFNVDAYRTSGGSSRDHRLVILTTSTGAPDINFGTVSANTVAFTVRNNIGSKLNPRAIDVMLNGSWASGLDGVGNPTGIVGTTTTAGTWNFVALTYDGTSTNANDSAAQLAATGGVSQVNGQLYFGTSATPVTRFDAPLNSDFTAHGDATKPSAGSITFDDSSKLLLANNTAATRGLDGYMDDFRIYNTILTATEVEALRQSVVPAQPGDYNSDGKVSAADYVLWRKNPAGFGGDPDGYNAWRASFGDPPGSGNSFAAENVPEPPIFALGSLLLASLVGRRRGS